MRRKAMRCFLSGCLLIAMALAGCNSSPPTPVPAVMTPTAASATPVPTSAPTATPNLLATYTTVALGSTATSVANRALLQKRRTDDLMQAKLKWQSLGITSYRITVKKGNSMNIERSVNSIVVRNGQIVDQWPFCKSANDTNCVFPNSSARAEACVIPALFDTVRDELDNSTRRVQTISYDSSYGFPAVLMSDTTTGATDFGYVQIVQAFEVLP